MNLYTLALRNTFRNRARAWLTLAGVAALILGFVFLRTLISAFHAGAEDAHSDRLVVRNRISLTMPLPVAYFDKIRAIEGVSEATYSNWFGGTYIDSRNFFPRFAVDPDSYFRVFKDIRIEPALLQAFKDDRTGCLIGEGLVERFKFKVGDVVRLKGDIYPGNWAFTVRGIFKSPNAFANSSLFFQYKYLDQSFGEGFGGYAGTFYVAVDRADDSPKVAKAIDSLFASSAQETLTESEQAFFLGFLSGSQAVLNALEAVSLVLLVIMLLILGNTLAMAVRERTSEIAVLRTIGFEPGQLRLLMLAEGVWLGLMGGVLGLVLAQPILKVFLAKVDGFIQGAKPAQWTLPALAIALAVGFFAALGPAITASRVQIVDALRRVE